MNPDTHLMDALFVEKVLAARQRPFEEKFLAGGILFEAAVERIEVIEFAAGDVEGAFGVNDDADAGGFDEDVAVGGGVLEIHFVLQAGAAAADDGYAQHAIGAALLGEKGVHLVCGAGSKFDEAFIAGAESWGGSRFGCGVGNHWA